MHAHTPNHTLSQCPQFKGSLSFQMKYPTPDQPEVAEEVLGLTVRWRYIFFCYLDSSLYLVVCNLM